MAHRRQRCAMTLQQPSATTTMLQRRPTAVHLRIPLQTRTPALKTTRSSSRLAQGLHRKHARHACYSLRAGVQTLVKADNEMARLKQVYELYRQVHALNGNAGIAGLVQIAHMASAFEALAQGSLRETQKHQLLHASAPSRRPWIFWPSCLKRARLPGPAGNSRRRKFWWWTTRPFPAAPSSMLWKRRSLKSVNVEDPQEALQLLTENEFDLVFLDVDMPEHDRL